MTNHAAADAAQAKRERSEMLAKILRTWNSVGTGLILVVAGFILTQLWDSGAKVSKLEERVTSMDVQMGQLYRSDAAARDMKDVQQEILRISTRIEQVERRVDGVERALRDVPQR